MVDLTDLFADRGFTVTCAWGKGRFLADALVTVLPALKGFGLVPREPAPTPPCPCPECGGKVGSGTREDPSKPLVEAYEYLIACICCGQELARIEWICND
jgi:hypothetical protein